MKISMKEDMGVAKKMTVKFWIAHTEHVILCKVRQTLLFAVYHGWKLGIAMKVSMNEGHGHCRQNDITKFGITKRT